MSSSAPCAPSKRIQPPLAPLLVEHAPHRLREGQHPRRDVEQPRGQLAAVDGRGAEAGAQRVVVGEEAVDPGLQRGGVAEIGDADAAPSDLVLVGRADAAAGGADLGRARRLLADAVEVLVERQDQRRVLGDHQVGRRDGDALAGELLDLGEQRPRVEHDAVADDAELAGAHDARGQQRQLVDLAVDDQRVAGVVPALEAHDDVRPLAQPVDDLALALVAPLCADDHDVTHPGLPDSALYSVPLWGPKPRTRRRHAEASPRAPPRRLRENDAVAARPVTRSRVSPRTLERRMSTKVNGG